MLWKAFPKELQLHINARGFGMTCLIITWEYYAAIFISTVQLLIMMPSCVPVKAYSSVSSLLSLNYEKHRISVFVMNTIKIKCYNISCSALLWMFLFIWLWPYIKVWSTCCSVFVLCVLYVMNSNVLTGRQRWDLSSLTWRKCILKKVSLSLSARQRAGG